MKSLLAGTMVCLFLFLSTAARAASTVTFSAGNEIAEQNASLGVPIDVSGFTTVSSFQFTLTWDPAVLNFSSEGGFANIGGFNSGNFGVSSTSSGVLTVSWDDPNFATDGGGVTLGNGGTLFLVNFMAIGNTGTHSDIDFADLPTVREVTIQGNAATFNSVPGGVDIVAVPEPALASMTVLGVACAAGGALLRRKSDRP